MNEQPPPQAENDERIERLIEKHERFMEFAMRDLRLYFRAEKVVDFHKLPSNKQHTLLNEFLIKTYSDSQSDFRTKLKVELLKLL